MTDKVQLIKEEIERRMTYMWSFISHDENILPNNFTEEDIKNLGSYTTLESLLKFIDSLPEESGCEANCTTKSEDLEEELERFAYSLPHSADGFWPKDIEPTSVEARTKYGVRHRWSYEKVMVIARHFAEWQEKKMLGIAEAFYQQGRYEQEQEMMKDAVETTIIEDWQYGKVPDRAIIPAINRRIDRFNIGDKVKIIIVKTDQQ